MRLVAIGDFGVGGARERAMGAAVERFALTYHTDLLVTLGDNDYSGDPNEFADNWRRDFGWTRSAGVDVAGTLGNHDVTVDRGRYEFGPLRMPAPYYVRRLGDVELFVLDSNAVDRKQTVWLRHALAASQARWKIAVFHHPAWTCGGHRRNEDVVARWVPLFERYGVRLALSGHDHNYQRFRRHGVNYVVDGGGGAVLYRLSSCPRSYPRRLHERKIHGFLSIVVRGDELELRARDGAGRSFDRLVIRAPM